MAVRPIFSLALICVIGLTITKNSVDAQNTPPDFLIPHNAARQEVGVGPMTWDYGVASYAEEYAKIRKVDCALEHSHGTDYGENIMMGTGVYSAGDAVASWVSEKENYDYDSNSCTGGECLHYTQVVWKDSIKLGCATVACDNGGTFITCNYSPPGNYNGERPY